MISILLKRLWVSNSKSNDSSVFFNFREFVLDEMSKTETANYFDVVVLNPKTESVTISQRSLILSYLRNHKYWHQ